ncbi:hypothetical protein Lokhon_00420 [Limimaricola hongkongensis DSM 17492]|uniref:Uncharacterized protein n=1 Tax=Limimaricola hongkongensis DSM 17492 TaxID=1122180 RepID=A0A017HI19_9RHOB|nr:hypothetical protein Lokhon_00420 [Limimaricola hongkongensis DSM 17492]
MSAPRSSIGARAGPVDRASCPSQARAGPRSCSGRFRAVLRISASIPRVAGRAAAPNLDPQARKTI